MISFIVQGPVSEDTQYTVDSIKEFFPSSEIILASTNGNADIKGVDKVHLDGEHEEVNVNKQILSSQAVNLAKFDISCKLRNDIIFTSDNLMKFVEIELTSEKSIPRLDSHRLFDRLVLNSNHFFCYPHTSGFFYHPSDWLFLGLTSDLQKLFNIPLQNPEENYYYLEETVTLPFGDTIQGDRLKYRPEQYILMQALYQAGVDVFLDYEYQVPDNVDDAYMWLINNFYVGDVGEDTGFYCSKYPQFVGQRERILNNVECEVLRAAMIKEFK